MINGKEKILGLYEVEILDKVAREDLSNTRGERQAGQGMHARPCWPSLKFFFK